MYMIVSDIESWSVIAVGELIRFTNDEWSTIKAHWLELKDLALQGVGATSRRSYSAALDGLRDWYDSTVEPRARFFSKATVQSYRSALEARGLASATINVQLAAIRKLAAECADNNLIAPEMAAGIARVKGMKRLGVRTDNWLTGAQAGKLIGTPDASIVTGKRDRAVLGALIGCGLRRSEVCALTLEHIQQRDGRWAIVDIKGKGGRIRTVPMPSWCKAYMDCWTVAAGITSRYVFRPFNRGGRLCGEQIRNPHSVWAQLSKYTAAIGLPEPTPHDLRRTFAKLAHQGHAALEQIQLSLGHSSIQRTERYLGSGRTSPTRRAIGSRSNCRRPRKLYLQVG